MTIFYHFNNLNLGCITVTRRGVKTETVRNRTKWENMKKDLYIEKYCGELLRKRKCEKKKIRLVLRLVFK